MKVTTSAEMREIDRRTIEEYGIPGVVLMETAGRAFSKACLDALGENPFGKHAVLFCGKGNNGGDGFVAARYLANAGVSVTVFLAGRPGDLKGDAAVFFKPLKDLHCIVYTSDEADELPASSLFDVDVIGDAVLGTGAKDAIDPDSEVGHLLKRMEAARMLSGAPVIACDIPSGVNADTGAVDRLTVRATRTVTFALPKRGLLQFPARDYVGRLTVAEIGIPRSLLTDDALGAELTTQHWMKGHVPPRVQSRDANKGFFGNVLVVAGSNGMAGAAVLTALSTLRSGTGLVRLAASDDVLKVAAVLAPEVVLVPLDRVEETAEKCDSVAIGPGIGGNKEAREFVQSFVKSIRRPLVIDADGLNALAEAGPEILRGREGLPTVLTPHPGEAGRLLGISTGEVQSDRVKTVTEIAKRYGATVLLKGARTLISEPDGPLIFNRLGSVALATAGTGDVLTGVIATFLAQGNTGMVSARIGAYLHALAGEIAEEQIGAVGVLAGEVRDRLPEARRRLYEGNSWDEWDTF